MNSLNSVLLEGNLAADPLDLSCDGILTCVFTLLVKRFYHVGLETSSEISRFRIKAYGNLAKLCLSDYKKASSLRIVGRLIEYRSEDEDGSHHSHVYILAEHIEHIGH